jgi:hypothetical protein
VKYIYLFFFLFPLLCEAQSTLTAKVHYGFSRPTSIEKSYRGFVSEVDGRPSQGFYLGFEKKIKRHSIRLQSGLSLMGFNTRQFAGFTPLKDFTGLSSFYFVKDSLLVFLKSTYRLAYVDNSIGYGFDLNPNIKLTIALHHLLNVRSQLKEIYSFRPLSGPNFNVLESTVDINLKDAGLQFYNHFASSLGIEFALTRGTKVGFNYQLGFTESNPFNVDRYAPILNQNFSLFLSQAIFVVP